MFKHSNWACGIRIALWGGTLALMLKSLSGGLSLAALVLFLACICFDLVQHLRYRRFVNASLAGIKTALETGYEKAVLQEPIKLGLTGELAPIEERINLLVERCRVATAEASQEKEEIHALNEELEASLEEILEVEREVTRQKSLFEALFQNSPDAIVMVDSNHVIMDVNRRFTQLFDYRLDEIRGLELDGIVGGPDRVEEANRLRDKMLGGEEVNTETIRYGKNMKPLEVSVKGVPILYQDWANGGYAIYSDISFRKAQEKALAYYGNHDHLTGLHNRRYFEEQIDILEDNRHGRASVFMADFNGLKLTNDAFGVETGDAQLRAFAEILREECGSEPLAARLDGDDFAVYLPGVDESGVQQLVWRIKNRCEQVRFGELPFSVSFGYAEVMVGNNGIHEAMKRAELYMNHHKLTEASSARGKTIQTVISTLHEKNRREEQHSQRVSLLSRALGEALGLSEREQRELKTMGLLHDVGKIAIDENILNKPGRLTDEEYAEIRRHPEIGYRILSASNDMAELAEFVLSHHERWDGTGYPRGLKGHEIPYLSRIIAVVDAYDAMTRDRAYREAMPEDDALKELRKNAGVQFDPAVVDVFLQRADVRYCDKAC